MLGFIQTRTYIRPAAPAIGLIALITLTLGTGYGWAETTPSPVIAEPVFETPKLDTKLDTAASATPSATRPHTVPTSATYTPDPALMTTASTTTSPNAAPVKTKVVTQTLYEELPAVLVLAIPSPTLGKKGFSDAAWRVGTELAHQMEIKHPNTTVHYPTQTIARLEKQHPHLLRTVWRQWAENGHVSSVAMNHLLDAVSEDPIARVVFVQADVDFNQPEKSWRPVDLYKKYLGDHIPNDARSYLRSTISVLNTQEPDQPLVWRGSWQHPIKNNQFGNITPSVYQDTDSIKSIGDASAAISQVLLLRAPKAAFAKPITVTTTQVIAKRSSHP